MRSERDHERGAEDSDARLPPRITAALAELLDAFEYSRDLKKSIWDFAVEMSCLRQLKLSRADLRWLVAQGLVESALEFTIPGDFERSFRRSQRPLLCKMTCFVLTRAGIELALRICPQSESDSAASGRVAAPLQWPTISTSMTSAIPTWDRDRQELRVGSIVVKRFKVPAANQEAVLAAFEEERWPSRIDDPLPPYHEQFTKRRLQETINCLNRNRKRPIIRFLGDGSGQGVRWEFCEP